MAGNTIERQPLAEHVREIKSEPARNRIQADQAEQPPGARAGFRDNAIGDHQVQSAIDSRQAEIQRAAWPASLQLDHSLTAQQRKVEACLVQCLAQVPRGHADPHPAERFCGVPKPFAGACQFQAVATTRYLLDLQAAVTTMGVQTEFTQIELAPLEITYNNIEGRQTGRIQVGWRIRRRLPAARRRPGETGHVGDYGSVGNARRRKTY